LFFKFRVIKLQNGLTALLISENENKDEDDNDENNEKNNAPSAVKKDKLKVYINKI